MVACMFGDDKMSGVKAWEIGTDSDLHLAALEPTFYLYRFLVLGLTNGEGVLTRVERCSSMVVSAVWSRLCSHGTPWCRQFANVVVHG